MNCKLSVRLWIPFLALIVLLLPMQQNLAQEGPSARQIDSLTAPIALYPDALLAQMLTASANFFEFQSFAGWLGQNAGLPGSALQDAAQKAGYDTCYVALAPFPQVVQMMMQQPDRTKQLGQAFAANRNAVFDSIQRLRAQARSMGNLQSTSQQEVEVQMTSAGQEVIVIQPANPQVVYVPEYNPQVVYAQSAPASAAGAAAVGFTAGVVIGAAANNHYYTGPYAWHGAAMYNEAWDNRSNYANQRQDAYQQNASQRQSASQSNQANRQSASQANQSERQSSASAAQGNRNEQQSQRQSAAATSSWGGGQGASERSGMSSGGFSGYQGGANTRAESSRGNSSLSAGRGGEGGGRGGGGGRSGGGGGRRGR